MYYKCKCATQFVRIKNIFPCIFLLLTFPVRDPALVLDVRPRPRLLLHRCVHLQERRGVLLDLSITQRRKKKGRNVLCIYIQSVLY